MYKNKGFLRILYKNCKKLKFYSFSYYVFILLYSYQKIDSIIDDIEILNKHYNIKLNKISDKELKNILLKEKFKQKVKNGIHISQCKRITKTK